MELHRNRVVLNKGEKIDGYTIEGLLGHGGYSDVYKVINSHGKEFAMKTEYLNAPKKALKYEIKIIKNLHNHFFPKVYADGETNDLIFLVLNILGPPIGCIQKLSYDAITDEFIYNFAIQSLSIIEKFHECGYIHRDIKPNNFLLKRDQNNPLNLIDFGIAKPYINFDTGDVLDPVPSRYKGTRKYASVNSHNDRDLGRCDDLFSWFYCILEMKIRKLPWEDQRNLDQVKKMKQNQVPILIKQYPELTKIYDNLIQLKFKDKPDYDYLRSVIIEEMKINGYSSNSFNWVDFYDKIKKLQDSSEKVDSKNEESDNNVNNNCKKETHTIDNCAVNQNPSNQIQNQQKETKEKDIESHHKHGKKNKKDKKGKKGKKSKSNGKDCIIS